MTNDPHSEGQRPHNPYDAATYVETDEDLRRALQSGLKGQPLSAPAAGGPAGSAAPIAGRLAGPVRPAAAEGEASGEYVQQTGGGQAASPFRPTSRPPVAILTVYDDGKIEGEIIRIRDHRFVIGRTEGDLRIPLDGRMSARHVEITHQVVGGLHRWVVTDLQSTHGLFLRVTRTILADKAEILVGSGRYRFDVPQPDAGTTANWGPEAPGRDVTQGWGEGP
jgi:hypothetical protein